MIAARFPLWSLKVVRYRKSSVCILLQNMRSIAGAMVLLQGLVFGRVLMDAIGRRGSQRALATTSSLGSYSSQKRPHKRRVRRTEPINPFLTEECLHRIGGSSIRCISTRHEPTVQEILNDETWYLLNKFFFFFFSFSFFSLFLA